MLKISEAQAASLRAAEFDDFTDRLVAHCEKLFPGAADVRQQVLAAIAKATGYGLKTELEICKYTNLAFIEGADFDSRAPWAAVFRKAGDRLRFDPAIDRVYEAWLKE